MESWDAQVAGELGADMARLERSTIGEEHDAAADLLRDELAEKLRMCGCRAGDAVRYVGAVLEVFAARDRRVVAAAVGIVEECKPDDVSDAQRFAAILKDVARDIEDAKRPRLQARVLRLACGDPDAESMRRAAKPYGLSVEHVSNLVEAVQVRYRLPKNQYNKSDAVCRTHRLANRRNEKE